MANRYYIGQDKNERDMQMAASSMNQLGVLYTHYFYDYEKAHKYLKQAEKIAKANHFIAILSSIYTNLGNIYLADNSISNNGNLDDRTVIVHQKAFEAALEANNPDAIFISSANLAHIADDTVYIELLRDDLKQFLQYQIPDSLKQFEYVKDFCRAILEQDKGNYDIALSLYDRALEHVYHKNARTCEILKRNINNCKGRLLIQLHQYPEVFDLINEQIRQGLLHKNHHVLYISYLALSDYYHNIEHDSIQGDRYELMAHREKDIVLSQNKLLDSEKVEFLFQIDEINAEVQALAARQRMTKIIAWGIAAFTLIILCLLYLLWRKYRQEQEKNRILYEKNQALLAAEDERRQQIIEAEEHKYQSHQMEEGEQSDLLHRILYIMESSEEVFQEKFTLDRLAVLVDAGSKYYVSQVLNDYYHQSFPEMVNDYRIREACRRLNDREHYGKLTVQAIAESLGFNSYPNFVNNFKKFTGLTPSAYRKQGKAAPEPPSVPPKEGEAS